MMEWVNQQTTTLAVCYSTQFNLCDVWSIAICTFSRQCSTHLPFNTSAVQHICCSTHLAFNTSAVQHIWRSTHLLFNTSGVKHICCSTHLALNTSAAGRLTLFDRWRLTEDILEDDWCRAGVTVKVSALDGQWRQAVEVL